MSYEIEYPGANKSERNFKVSKKRKSIIITWVIVCVVLLVSVYSIGLDTIKEYIIPGDNDDTIAAFSKMKDNLSDGMPMKDAVEAFCTEIIQSANIQ